MCIELEEVVVYVYRARGGGGVCVYAPRQGGWLPLHGALSEYGWQQDLCVLALYLMPRPMAGGGGGGGLLYE